MTERETPKFTGITVHRDPRGRFAVRYPTDWQTFEIRSEEPLAGAMVAERNGAGDQGGVDQIGADQSGAGEAIAAQEGLGFAPDPSDPFTVFTVWASSLGENVAADDLDVLRAGVDEGLQLLPASQVETAAEIVLGNLMRFERIYSFREGDAVRRRKQWLVYVDQWLICLTWQGATPAAYDFWFAMANQSFLTFELPEALWYSADRDLSRR